MRATSATDGARCQCATHPEARLQRGSRDGLCILWLTEASPWASYFLLSCSSSSLQDGAQTACALPSTFLVPIMERGRCLPHMKQDMVALPKEVVATKGEPETLDL